VKFSAVVTEPLAVVTVTGPVVAPVGTVTCMDCMEVEKKRGRGRAIETNGSRAQRVVSRKDNLLPDRAGAGVNSRDPRLRLRQANVKAPDGAEARRAAAQRGQAIDQASTPSNILQKQRGSAAVLARIEDFCELAGGEVVAEDVASVGSGRAVQIAVRRLEQRL
jgi:hypothetical protein